MASSSGALSRSRYLLEQERKKEEEEKRRTAHAASLFEAKAKEIEAAFEITRIKRAEAQRKELEAEVRLQREKYQRDKKRAEEVKAAFALQKEAARQISLKDLSWRKKCYAASLYKSSLPFEPSLSGILMACSAECAYTLVLCCCCCCC
jgi:histidyl-tRNA synthetase